MLACFPYAARILASRYDTGLLDSDAKEPPAQTPFPKTTAATLYYPAAILTAALTVLMLVFVFVVPKFKAVFESIGKSSLHWTTQLVMSIGDHMKAWWWTYLVGIVLVVALHRLLLANVFAYRSLMRNLALRAPLFGRLSEPILLVFMAAVGFIVFALFMPLITMMQKK